MVFKIKKDKIYCPKCKKVVTNKWWIRKGECKYCHYEFKMRDYMTPEFYKKTKESFKNG